MTSDQCLGSAQCQAQCPLHLRRVVVRHRSPFAQPYRDRSPEKQITVYQRTVTFKPPPSHVVHCESKSPAFRDQSSSVPPHVVFVFVLPVSRVWPCFVSKNYLLPELPLPVINFWVLEVVFLVYIYLKTIYIGSTTSGT